MYNLSATNKLQDGGTHFATLLRSNSPSARAVSSMVPWCTNRAWPGRCGNLSPAPPSPHPPRGRGGSREARQFRAPPCQFGPSGAQCVTPGGKRAPQTGSREEGVCCMCIGIVSQVHQWARRKSGSSHLRRGFCLSVCIISRSVGLQAGSACQLQPGPRWGPGSAWSTLASPRSVKVARMTLRPGKVKASSALLKLCGVRGGVNPQTFQIKNGRSASLCF